MPCNSQTFPSLSLCSAAGFWERQMLKRGNQNTKNGNTCSPVKTMQRWFPWTLLIQFFFFIKFCVEFTDFESVRLSSTYAKTIQAERRHIRAEHNWQKGGNIKFREQFGWERRGNWLWLVCNFSSCFYFPRLKFTFLHSHYFYWFWCDFCFQFCIANFS